MSDPTRKCPYCGEECSADFTDIGVGNMQTGPYSCENCFAVEIGPNEGWVSLSDEERKIGWYKPGMPPISNREDNLNLLD